MIGSGCRCNMVRGVLDVRISKMLSASLGLCGGVVRNTTNPCLPGFLPLFFWGTSPITPNSGGPNSFTSRVVLNGELESRIHPEAQPGSCIPQTSLLYPSLTDFTLKFYRTLKQRVPSFCGEPVYVSECGQECCPWEGRQRGVAHSPLASLALHQGTSWDHSDPSTPAWPGADCLLNPLTKYHLIPEEILQLWVFCFCFCF